MVNYCCVRGCKKEAYPGSGLSFHGLPKDALLREKWLKAIPGNPSKTSIICGLHFKQEDFHLGLFKRKLKSNVVPSIFPEDPINSDTQKDQKNAACPESCNSSKVDEEGVMRKSTRKRTRICYAEKEEGECSPTVISSDLQEDPLKPDAQGDHNNVGSPESCSFSDLQEDSSEMEEEDSDPKEPMNLAHCTVPSSPSPSHDEPLMIVDTSSSDEQSMEQSIVPSNGPCITIKPMGIKTTTPDCQNRPRSPTKVQLKSALAKKSSLIEEQSRKVKILSQRMKRLRNRNLYLTNILKTMKKELSIDSKFFDKFRDNIVASDLFINYNRNNQNKPVKLTPALKKFCLTLYKISPEAYDYVRQTLNSYLPHSETLMQGSKHEESFVITEKWLEFD